MRPRGREQLSRSLLAELLSREQRTLGPQATPARAAGTPTRLVLHVQKALFLRSIACLPTRSGLGSAPSLKPVPRTASGCAGGVGKGIGSVSSPTYPKDFKVRLWPDLNPWRTGYWPQGLGEEHWERSPGTCALAPAQSPRAVRPWASHFTSADWLPHWGLLLYPQSHL